MILPPNPMTRCFLHPKDQFKMVFREYRAALKMSSSDSEMETEVQQEAVQASNNMETNDSQQRTSEASLSHPGANPGDSSSAMLVGYTTMEEGVQKEAEPIITFTPILQLGRLKLNLN